MTLPETIEWAEMEATIRRAVESLEECAVCGLVKECELLAHICQLRLLGVPGSIKV